MWGDNNEVAIKLEQIAGSFEACMKMAKEDKLKLHDRIGAELQQVVRSNIASSINDAHGKVQEWQAVRGSYGYAAIRARRSTKAEAEDSASSPGAITNYLENGTVSGIRPRSFYDRARTIARSIAHREAEAFKEKLAERIREGIK